MITYFFMIKNIGVIYLDQDHSSWVFYQILNLSIV